MRWEATREKWEWGKFTSHFPHGNWKVGNGTQMGIPNFKISSSKYRRLLEDHSLIGARLAGEYEQFAILRKEINGWS